MLREIVNSGKTLKEKIEELWKYSHDPRLLDDLISPEEFLKDLIVFVRHVFRTYPPDPQYGQANDTRVLFIRLLSKLKYGNAGTSDLNDTLSLVYELFATENLF